MKRFLALAVLGAFAFAPLPALAADTKADNAQQQKMKDCNAKAGDMKGDERQKFMSTCLKAGSAAPAAAAPMSQQDKMTMCNKKAGDMKGDDRKKFMSDCLKG